MINIFLLSILATLLFTPLGLLTNKKELNFIPDYEKLSRLLIYSIIVVSFIALFLNFFTPLNRLINTIFLLIPIIILINYKNYFFKFRYLLFAILISLISFFLIAKSNTYRPDAGLYHLPFISILNNEKIIFGLSNFHFRFGHISIIQYTSAFFNNFIFLNNGIVLPAALIYAGVVVNFFFQIKNYLYKKDYNFHLIYLISVTIYIVGKMNRYSEFGNDSPSHIFFLFLLSEILKNNFSHKISEIKNFFLLSIFIIMNKIFFIFSIFFPLIFLSKKNFQKIILNSKMIFISLFVILWLLKNIIISGCALYPIKFTCFTSLPWTDIKQAKIVSNENEAWAKSWPGHDNKNGKISHSDYIKKFYWVKTWLMFNGFKSFKIIFVYSLILTVFGLAVYSNKKVKHSSKFKNKYLRYTLIILIFGTLIWFLKAPDYRYGTGYIIGLLSLIFANIICKRLNKNFKNISITILTISIFVFLINNSIRIFTENSNYLNNPWPKYYSHSSDNIYIKPNKITIDGKNLYIAKGLCMYGLAPCSRNKGKFKIIKKFNYDFFINK